LAQVFKAFIASALATANTHQSLWRKV